MFANLIILTIFFFIFPFLAIGLIKKIRAKAQGRKGPPLFQNLYDLIRLAQKKPVDGENSGIFAEVSPLLIFISGIFMWSVSIYEWLPFLFIPFFGLIQRVFTIGFGMETSTSFGGLGSAREILLSISSEPIILIAILVSGSSLQIQFHWIGLALGGLFLGALLVAILAELARPPFDDPRTHLELTMVHEAMLLEASGRSLFFIELGYQLRIATLFVLVTRIGLEHSKFANSVLPKLLENLLTILFAILISIFLGIWESVSVRRKWVWVPELLGMTLLFILALGSLVKLI